MKDYVRILLDIGMVLVHHPSHHSHYLRHRPIQLECIFHRYIQTNFGFSKQSLHYTEFNLLNIQSIKLNVTHPSSHKSPYAPAKMAPKPTKTNKDFIFLLQVLFATLLKFENENGIN